VAKALGFLLLFALTNASLFFLFPLSAVRVLAVACVYASGTVLMLAALFHPRIQWLVDGQLRVACGPRPCVALTFDDGPTPDLTPRVLAVLREKDVKATFFWIGRQVERHPEIARLVSGEGHAIANHSDSHPSLFCFLTPRRLQLEIERAQQAIIDAIGVAPRFFRPPVGLRHPLLEVSLERANLKLILWQIRTYDTRSTTAEALRTRILGRILPGAIVLLHDRPSPGSRAMLDALPVVIDELRARGYAFVTLDGSVRP
jgi:peptidoglycan/xylan/chitin deacetylase (PgdA/CDA1 family)